MRGAREGESGVLFHVGLWLKKLCRGRRLCLCENVRLMQMGICKNHQVEEEGMLRIACD